MSTFGKPSLLARAGKTAAVLAAAAAALLPLLAPPAAHAADGPHGLTRADIRTIFEQAVAAANHTVSAEGWSAPTCRSNRLLGLRRFQ